MEAFNARRFVCEEIDKISSVSLLISSTCLLCSIAVESSPEICATISDADTWLAAASAFMPSAFWRILSTRSSPSPVLSAITVISFRILSMFSVILITVADTSSMLAASCSIVADVPVILSPAARIPLSTLAAVCSSSPEPFFIFSIRFLNTSINWLNPRTICPISSLPLAFRCVVRLPLPPSISVIIFMRSLVAARIGFTTPIRITRIPAIPTRIDTAAIPTHTLETA